MGCRRNEHRERDLEKMDSGNYGRHNLISSLMSLIFGIVSLSFKLAFKIVEMVFMVLSGLISGFTSASRGSGKDKGDSAGQEPSAMSMEEQKDSRRADNVREFRKPESSRKREEAPEAETEQGAEEVRSKDFYIFLFILTIIPLIVTLAMGKLLYAGVIGAAGFGLMIIAGIISKLAGISRKKAEDKMPEEHEEEKDENSVERLIKDAFEKIFEIRKDIGRITDAEVRAKLEAICVTGEKIIGEVRTNPESLALVRKFFYYYIDAFGEIVKKYLRLSNFEESSEEIGRLVEETEKSFSDIDGIFKDFCEKLMEKDIMHLKAEINVIKNSN